MAPRNSSSQLNTEYGIDYRKSDIGYWISGIIGFRYIGYRMSDIELRSSGDEGRLSGAEYRMSDLDCRWSNIEYSAANGTESSPHGYHTWPTLLWELKRVAARRALDVLSLCRGSAAKPRVVGDAVVEKLRFTPRTYHLQILLACMIYRSRRADIFLICMIRMICMICMICII